MCIYVLSIVATSFNLQLCNFGIIFRKSLQYTQLFHNHLIFAVFMVGLQSTKITWPQNLQIGVSSEKRDYPELTVIYPYCWHVHSPHVSIMYEIGSLLYVWLILSKLKNMSKNSTNKYWPCKFLIILMPNIVVKTLILNPWK